MGRIDRNIWDLGIEMPNLKAPLVSIHECEILQVLYQGHSSVAVAAVESAVQ